MPSSAATTTSRSPGRTSPPTTAGCQVVPEASARTAGRGTTKGTGPAGSTTSSSQPSWIAAAAARGASAGIGRAPPCQAASEAVDVNTGNAVRPSGADTATTPVLA